MSHVARTLWTLALLVLALPGSNALPLLLLDDAGSGQDAPGTPADALPVAYGDHMGNLTAGDSDWYAFPALDAAMCLDATLLGRTSMAPRILTAGGSEIGGSLQEGVFATTLAVAPGEVRFGVVPDAAPWQATSVGPYAFGASVSPPSAAGDSRDDDAGGSLATAVPVPSTCFSGHARSDGPDVDAFAFTAATGDIATVSFALSDATGWLQVVATNGTALATVASGEATQLLLADAGTYFLVATAFASDDRSSYTTGLVIGPPGQGCRPACLEV